MKITEFVTEDWQKTNRKDKTSGMSRKAVKQYRRENPGSKLQTAVTTKPSKLKKGSKSAKRRKSFCARMRGMKKSRTSAKTARNPNSNINKALRRWNCESIEQMQELVMIAEQKIAALRQGMAEDWEAKTQPDGNTHIAKQGSMSSAEYKQSMADYKAKNWTPEKMADYSQRMASGQGYSDEERAANYQQQQQHFGKYADRPIDEAGPFSYGVKKPRKGSVADLAAKKRREQEKDKQPVEPRDHRVGVARVVKGVAEATGDPKFDKMLKGITSKGQVAKQQRADTKQQARDAFGGMFGGGNPADKLGIRKKGVSEATGDEKFDAMMGKIAAEPKVPDMHPNMPPTSIPELLHWAKQNNKPYHYKFAEWAKKHNFTNVNDALEWFGDNVDPWDEFGPKEHLNVFGDIVGEPLIDAAKHNPKAAELLKVFACYEKIYDDWTDEYRQMKEQGLAEGSNRFQVGDKISFPLSQMATGIVDKIDDKRLYVKLDNGDVYTIPSSMLHSVKLLERQGVAENTTPDDEKVLELFAQIVADDTGYSVKKVNYEIYDEGLRTPSGIPVYFYSFDGDVRYIGALPGGKPTAIVNQDGKVGSRGSHLELSIGGQVEYIIKGKTLFSAADQQKIANAKPGDDEYSLVMIALDLMWGRMQHKFMEQGVAEGEEDIVAVIDGVRSNRTYNDRYHAHNSLSKLVGYGKAKVAELYINGEKVEHFELGKKYIDFEPKSLRSMSEAGAFSYGAKNPRKGGVADLAAQKRQEQERGRQSIEPRDQRVGTTRIIK